jgi:hypothetical protein
MNGGGLVIRLRDDFFLARHLQSHIDQRPHGLGLGSNLLIEAKGANLLPLFRGELQGFFDGV